MPEINLIYLMLIFVVYLVCQESQIFSHLNFVWFAYDLASQRDDIGCAKVHSESII